MIEQLPDPAPRPGRPTASVAAAPDARTDARAPRSLLAWLRRLHRWLGLALMLPMLLQGLTGTILVVSTLTTPDRPQRTASAVDAASLPATAIVAAARAVAPPADALLRYSPAGRAGDSVEVGFGRPGRRNPDMRVLVDPASGTILGTRRPSALLALVRGWHTALLLPMPLGRTLIGWVGIALLLLAVIGIPLWWPRPAGRRLAALGRGATVSSRAKGPRLWRELHVALGTWTGLMILLMSGTGIVMSFPQTTRALLGLPAMMRPDGGDHRPGHAPGHGREHEPGNRLDARHGPAAQDDGMQAAPDDSLAAQGLDQAVAALRRVAPDANAIDITLSAAPAPFNVRYTAPGQDGPQNARIDRDGTVHVASKGVGRGWREGITTWSHLLHEAKPPFPSWAVTLWKLLVALTGISLVLFSISGFLVWLLRRLRRNRTRAAAGAAR